MKQIFSKKNIVMELCHRLFIKSMNDSTTLNNFSGIRSVKYYSVKFNSRAGNLNIANEGNRNISF